MTQVFYEMECEKGHRFASEVDIEQECPVCQSLYGMKVNDNFVRVNKKKTIPEYIRWAVWERDNFTCRHCGSRSKLCVDHIFPESKGGEATLENCQTLCKSCNSRKGAK